MKQIGALGWELAQAARDILRALVSEKKARVSPFEKERQAFEKDVREQLLKLKEKGLSIPIFTL